MKLGTRLWTFKERRKRYRNVVQIDSCKEAEIIVAMEGFENVFGNAVVNDYTEDLYRHNKVQMTIMTRRTKIGAILRSFKYSRMRIMNYIIEG